MFTRRYAFAAFSAAMVAPLAAAFAQAGGIPSTTARSNSEGTPAPTGTGTVGETRVGPATTDSAAPVRTRHRRHRHHRHARTPAQ